jgi:predicted N-acetyltransferase YhbS
MAIRPERAGDADRIGAVHAAAFPTDAEARLVRLLRAEGQAGVSGIVRYGPEFSRVAGLPDASAGDARGTIAG